MRNQIVEKACIFINNISFTVSSSDESLLMKCSQKLLRAYLAIIFLNRDKVENIPENASKNVLRKLQTFG